MVALDLKVGADEVRLFTHTLEPVRLADGKAVYGCTEFVFRFEPGTRGEIVRSTDDLPDGLVVLDVEVKGNEVHLLTHTADPVPGMPSAPSVFIQPICFEP